MDRIRQFFTTQGRAFVLGGALAVALLALGYSLYLRLTATVPQLADEFVEELFGLTPDEPEVSTCTVSLTLERFRVADDTEVGAEEWAIWSYANPGGGGRHDLSADEDDGWVTVGHQMSREQRWKIRFPSDASYRVTVSEVDGEVKKPAADVFNETGSQRGTGYRLSCPDSRAINMTIVGTGLDLFIIEDFKVDLEFTWEVAED